MRTAGRFRGYGRHDGDRIAMRTVGRSITAAAVLGHLAACGGGGYTLKGRSRDPCLEEIPACPHAGFAECVLDPHRYAERRFPGIFNFLVDVDAGTELEVVLLLAEQRDAGITTQFTWNEPGCTDSYTQSTPGIDLFAEARNNGVLTRTQRLLEDGEHLIEIESDMQARALITVD